MQRHAKIKNHLSEALPVNSDVENGGLAAEALADGLKETRTPRNGKLGLVSTTCDVASRGWHLAGVFRVHLQASTLACNLQEGAAADEMFFPQWFYPDPEVQV